MKYPLIIFDWDGTLMDSVGRIVSSMQQTARYLELQVPTEQAVRDIIGISLNPAIERLFGRLEVEQYDQFMNYYRQCYVVDDPTPSPLFNKAHDVLAELRQRGHRLAVATGKARHGLERVWDESKSRHYFDFSRCADESESKPSPKMLQDILDQAGVSVDQAIMVGDSIHDMKMAENMGMARVGVSFGAHNRQRLMTHQPLAVIDQLSDLLQHV